MNDEETDRLISLCRPFFLEVKILKYKVGDTVYLIESNRLIRECTVKRVSGNLYVVRFANGGGIQVKEHRLFATQEEAESSRLVKEVAKTNYRSTYEYWH